jgi:hypothetical protein
MSSSAPAATNSAWKRHIGHSRRPPNRRRTALRLSAVVRMYKLSDPSSPWCRLHRSPLHDWCFVVLCSATSEAATSEAATSDRHSEWAGTLTAAVSGTLALLALQGNDPTGRPSRLDRRCLSWTSFQPGRFEGFPDRRRPGPAAAASAASPPRVLAGRTYTYQTQVRDKTRISGCVKKGISYRVTSGDHQTVTG